jgi:hypothetical protein
MLGPFSPQPALARPSALWPSLPFPLLQLLDTTVMLFSHLPLGADGPGSPRIAFSPGCGLATIPRVMACPAMLQN